MKDKMAQNVPGLKRDINLHNDRVKYILDRMIKNKSTPRYISLKFQNSQNQKKKVLKAIKDEISIAYKGTKIRIIEDVSQS